MHKSVISKNTWGKVWLAVASGGACAPFAHPWIRAWIESITGLGLENPPVWGSNSPVRKEAVKFNEYIPYGLGVMSQTKKACTLHGFLARELI